MKNEKFVLYGFYFRSINSPKAFKAYIEELETIYQSKVVEVHLKNKKMDGKVCLQKYDLRMVRNL